MQSYKIGTTLAKNLPRKHNLQSHNLSNIAVIFKFNQVCQNWYESVKFSDGRHHAKIGRLHLHTLQEEINVKILPMSRIISLSPLTTCPNHKKHFVHSFDHTCNNHIELEFDWLKIMCKSFHYHCCLEIRSGSPKQVSG